MSSNPRRSGFQVGKGWSALLKVSTVESGHELKCQVCTKCTSNSTMNCTNETLSDGRYSKAFIVGLSVSEKYNTCWASPILTLERREETENRHCSTIWQAFVLKHTNALWLPKVVSGCHTTIWLCCWMKTWLTLSCLSTWPMTNLFLYRGNSLCNAAQEDININILKKTHQCFYYYGEDNLENICNSLHSAPTIV